MATLVEFSVSTETFSFGTLFGTIPGVSVELERLVPTTESLFPYVWIRGASTPEVEAALEAAPETAGFTQVDDLGTDGILYRTAWNPAQDGVLKAIAESDVTLLSATGKRDRWLFRLRVENHGALGEFRTRCRDREIDIEVARVQPLQPIEHSGGITPAQFEALELAYRGGYFDDPRRATLDDLAAELGITRQSLAGRLRRGHRNLLTGLFDGDNGFDRLEGAMSRTE
ncbi:bacterio-opsin activator [Natronolimnobius sp. AArcel1]|uniref:helix-turn-helix domain-containing protein n=1 Tax=Natronolimnobius sp. AArcel1 TaxID=1679093 RepID=UPI0013EDFBD3|nr:helix-turn-helix domain-containing protein [Natronolimnobius sp. AArcel1]NGM68612.1 bacterio-opsin activator [Natronolimnobius sp. AArcel1]